MTTEYVCECGCPPATHAGRTYACRVCACSRYAPDVQRAAAERVESTSAALRRVQAELDEARQLIAVHEQLEAKRDWIVARDGCRWCELCEQEVRRGQAYELEPGTGGLVRHIHCPERPESTSAELVRLREHMRIQARVVVQLNAELDHLRANRQTWSEIDG